MLETERTSQTEWLSAEGLDDLPCEGERERFDELPLVFDEHSPVMRRESGHNILTLEFAANEIFGAVELERATAVDFADERHSPLGNRKHQASSDIDVGVERETVREMAKDRPELITKDSGEASSVFGDGEASTGLLEVVVSKEAIACPAQGPQIRAAMKQDAPLPETVKTFHGGVATGFSRGNEDQMDPQKKMKPNRLGDTVALPASSGGGHFVIHLRDLGQSHKAPGINKMATERDRLFIRELTGRSRLTDDIDRMDGIDADDAPRSPQVTGADQVGLMKLPHPAGSEVRIRGSAGKTSDFDFFRFTGPGQDLFDRRDGGKSANASLLEFEMNRFGADAGESRPAALVGRQLIAESQDRTDESLSRFVPDMFGGSASVQKTGHAESFIAVRPLGEPEASPLDLAKNFFKTNSFSKKLDRSGSPLIFAFILHRPTLLPIGMRKSLGDAKSVCDVLTVF